MQDEEVNKYILIGDFEFKKHNFVEAIEQYTRALKRESNNFAILNSRGGY